MIKIKSVRFVQHPVLGDACFDFTDESGHAADVVIIAGENGTGKSRLLEALYGYASGSVPMNQGPQYEVCVEHGLDVQKTTVQTGKSSLLWPVKSLEGRLLKGQETRADVRAIFSEVGINYRSSREINSVTSLSLDCSLASYRTTGDLALEIKQLLVDVQALDDQEISRAYRDAKVQGIDLNLVKYDSRMDRFSRAFSYMFTDLRYDRIENQKNRKVVMFKKRGVDVSLDDLSSGEKQIVFRGCFLLRNINATKGAVVFVDEPEISLHPEWQKKILGFYRNIFSDRIGNQTSQIFVVTHSPFVVHSDDRENDKVIVLARSASGKVEVLSRPEYYTIGPQEAVRDAFRVERLDVSTPCVFVEGRTDEKYLNKALEVFGVETFFKFKWIGYLDANNQERNTGSSALDKGREFILAQKLTSNRFVFLYDGDVRKSSSDEGNVHVRSVPVCKNEKGIKKGIENALSLDSLDMTVYYSEKKTLGDYGEHKVIQEFHKMELCDDICSMGNAELKTIFRNLKPIIDELSRLFESQG